MGPEEEAGSILPSLTPARDSASLPYSAAAPTSPSSRLLPSAPPDICTPSCRRKKPTRQGLEGEVYCKNCTKGPVCWPGLGLCLPGHGTDDWGSASAEGAQAGGGSRVCTQSIQSSRREGSWGHTSPGPRRERQWAGCWPGSRLPL